MIWEGDMVFWQPAEKPEVMIVGPMPTIVTEGFSKVRQKPISPKSNHVITIITTSPCRPWISHRGTILNIVKMENKKIS